MGLNPIFQYAKCKTYVKSERDVMPPVASSVMCNKITPNTLVDAYNKY